MDELSVQEQADTDALRDRDGHEVAHVLRVPAEPQLGQRTGVGRVLEHDRQPHAVLDELSQIDLTPPQVGREDEPSRSVDPSW